MFKQHGGIFSKHLENTAKWNIHITWEHNYGHIWLLCVTINNTSLYPASLPTVCVCAPVAWFTSQESMSIAGVDLQPVCANIRAWYLSIINHVPLCRGKSKCVSPWKQPHVCMLEGVGFSGRADSNLILVLAQSRQPHSAPRSHTWIVIHLKLLCDNNHHKYMITC